MREYRKGETKIIYSENLKERLVIIGKKRRCGDRRTEQRRNEDINGNLEREIGDRRNRGEYIIMPLVFSGGFLDISL